MNWSMGDVLGVIGIMTTLVSVFVATSLFWQKFGQIANVVKNLGIRVDKLEIRMDKLENRIDKLEKKLDEIFFFLSRKSKKRRWKH